MKRVLIAATFAAGLFGSAAFGQSQTAQSAMVQTNLNSTAYIIEGTITWTFDREMAETYYTNAWDGLAPAVTVGGGSTQTSPGAPAPDANELMQLAQADRCTFFFGGSLRSTTYTRTVNGTKGWKWTYTYNITPNAPGTVAAATAWSSATTGGTVDVGFSGFVSSESFLQQSKKTKYSFTLLDSTGSRVTNVRIALEQKGIDGVWTQVGDAISYPDPLPVTATTADYSYYGNAGIFGNSAVYGYLHAPNELPAANVSAILTSDTFANNDGDLTAGNVQQANYTNQFTGLTNAGDYRIRVSGTVKGNSATADQQFSVTSNQIVIGGCEKP